MAELFFAEEELNRYLREAEGYCAGSIEVAISPETFSVPDSAVDDAYSIDVARGKGCIRGANKRSVLMGVYRFLRESGVAFIRPGSSGEMIPPLKSVELTVSLESSFLHRHRGICIEGACSQENVLNMIDWLPKVGLNGYFMQFREGFIFYDRWYNHRTNPFLEAEPFTREQAAAHAAEAAAQAAKRGLMYHGVGHGWTCEALGIPGLGWDEDNHHYPAEKLNQMAEVKGKRGLWEKVPIATALCHSHKKTNAALVNCIADYAQSHRGIEYLHFWLDDGFNNKCECDGCRETRLSDTYIVLLNSLDEELTHRGLDTRIVFLVYKELLWPPLEETFDGHSRFTLMFAPIQRRFDQILPEMENLPEIPPYKLNEQLFPKRDNATALSFLKGWNEKYKGDSFDFDYHMNPERDPGQFVLSKVLYEDLKGLKSRGLNGYMSCQIQRAFAPSGLAMYVMARVQEKPSMDWDEIASEYFAAAFGSSWEEVFLFFKELSESWNRFDEENPCDTQAARRLLKQQPSCRSDDESLSKMQRFSWKIMSSYLSVLDVLLAMGEAIAVQAGDDVIRGIWKQLVHRSYEVETEIQMAFDAHNFLEDLEDLVPLKE